MTDRIPCACAPCRRTMGKAAAIKRWGWAPREWICQAHWSRLTKAERRVWQRILRRERKLGFQPRPEVAARVWAAVKRRAS